MKGEMKKRLTNGKRKIALNFTWYKVCFNSYTIPETQAIIYLYPKLKPKVKIDNFLKIVC